MKRKIVWSRIGSRFPGYADVKERLGKLSPGENLKDRVEQYYREKAGLMIKTAGAGILLALALLVMTLQQTELQDSYFLPRREMDYQKELQLQIEGEESLDMTVSVEPKRLTGKESQELLEEIRGQMEAWILGENRTLDEVRSALNLVSEIEGTPVTVIWELDSYEVLNLDGSIRTENLKEEGSIVELTAHLTCNEETAVYRAYARILPPVFSPEELFERELQEKLAKLQEESSESGQMELPREIQGRTVIWKEKKSWSAAVILLLTLLCIPLLCVAKDRDLEKQMKERERQMCRDYAQIVSKLVLLMGAGTTIRNAWEQLVRDYQRKRERGQAAMRYAYEEMALTCHEMQNGVAEGKAYENFGLRCRIPCYLKLSALLEQNLKKGSKGLTTLLKLEVQEAFEQRKELARIQGEETATKLLLPMILMLAVIMILILTPAVMSMQI